MFDFPRSLLEFQRRFPYERACAAYLAGTRWPDGFRCPACDRDKGWELATKAFTWEGAGCGKQTSVTAGTVMHGSKVPLVAWFWAAYLMATHSNGISALQVQKQLGLGSYKTAWLLCAKLRRAMVAPSPPAAERPGGDRRDRNSAAQQGRSARGLRGPQSGQGKMLVAGAVEVHGHRPGRVRLAPIADFSAASLHAFINANIAAGATAKTDGWSAYPGAPGITHHPHVVGPMAAHVVLPWAHRLFANLKRWARSASTTACAASTCNPTSTKLRVPLQSPQHPPCGLPLAAPHRRHHQTHHLQHARSHRKQRHKSFRELYIWLSDLDGKHDQANGRDTLDDLFVLARIQERYGDYRDALAEYRRIRIMSRSSSAYGRPLDQQLLNMTNKRIARMTNIRVSEFGADIKSIKDDIAHNSPRGALVLQVEAGGPAATAGLVPGDILLALDGAPVASDYDLKQILNRTLGGKSVETQFWRQHQRNKIMVKLGEKNPTAGGYFPDDILDAMIQERLYGRRETEIKELGLTVTQLNDELRRDYDVRMKGDGILVTRVGTGSYRGGVRSGDVILGMWGRQIPSEDELLDLIRNKSSIRLSIRHGRKKW